MSDAFDDYRNLIEDRDQLRVHNEQLRADLSESRRLLDEARAQKPLFWYRPHRNGMGYDGPVSDETIEQSRKESGVWVALYAAPVPAQPAAVPEAVAKDAIPAGWVFHSADFSMQSCGAQDYGRVALIRDQDGRKWWHSLSDEAKESTKLYYYGKGKTVALAIQNASAAILSAADTEVKNG